MDPAIKGTLNVLTAAKQAGVKRVVLTSSISAITPSPSWPGDAVKREDCWTDIEYCKHKGVSSYCLLLSNAIKLFKFVCHYLHFRVVKYNADCVECNLVSCGIPYRKRWQRKLLGNLPRRRGWMWLW